MGKHLELFNNLAQLGGYITDELSEADIKNKSYQFNDELNQLMQDFNNSPEYETFQEKYDEFFSRWEDNIVNNSKTAKSHTYMNDMIQQSKLSTKFNLQQSIINSQRKTAMMLDSESKSNIKSSKFFTTQDKVQRITEINNNAYSKGNFADAVEYENTYINDISDVIYSSALDIGMTAMSTGATKAEALELAYKEIEEEYSIPHLVAGTLDTDEGSSKINRDGIKSLVLKELSTYESTVIKEVQDKNAGKMSEYVALLWNTTGQDQLNLLGQAQSYLLGCTGNLMSDTDRRTYTHEIENVKKTLESGNTTTPEGNSSVKVAMAGSLVNDPDAMIQMIKNGDYDDIRCMIEAVKNSDKTMLEEYLGRTLKDDEYMVERAKVLGDFIEKVKSSDLLPTKVKDLLKNYTSIIDDTFYMYTKDSKGNGKTTKEWARENNQIASEIYSNAYEILLDMIYDCRIADQSEVDGLAKRFSEQIGALYLKTLDFDLTKKGFESNEDVYARVIPSLMSDASAYTIGKYGEEKEVYMDGAEAAMTAVGTYSLDKVASWLDLDKSELSYGKSMTDHDIDAMPIVTDGKGNQFRISSDGKKISVQKYENGNWVDTTESKTKNHFASAKEREQYFIDLANAFVEYSNSTKNYPPGVSERTWRLWATVPGKRRDSWEAWIKDNKEQAEKLALTYGLNW